MNNSERISSQDESESHHKEMGESDAKSQTEGSKRESTRQDKKENEDFQFQVKLTFHILVSL
jgi:hypothetical protein